MTEEQKKAENDPQHPKYKVLFGQYTWWRSSDNRVFVITSRGEQVNGDIESINLLEQNKELPHFRPYSEVFELYQKGMLERTSVMAI
jgi:hypothetical protein